MTMKITVDLVHEWSITEKGESHVDLVPKNRPNDIKASFTFETQMFVDALNEDIDNDTLDIEEWLDAAEYHERTAAAIRNILKERAYDID